MSKPKFKVGDKVRILDGSKIKDYCGGWVDGMKRYIGKTATIKSVESYKGFPTGYRLKEYNYKWDERGLELVKSEKIIIYRNGSEVIAKNTATGKTGVAKCNPTDEFDFNIGAKLAFDRLVEPEPEEPKCYTGKVICVKSCNPSCFTEGKIYKVVDGLIFDNDGTPSIHNYKTLNDINKAFLSKFIKLIED